MNENRTIWQLFITFFRIGAFTFGGGYAMIPLIQREVVENKAWIKETDLLDVIAIAEATPGPIAINAATFVGYKTGKLRGAIAATLGVVLPSLVIILAISFFMQKLLQLEMVEHAFRGIRIGVLALLVKAFLNMRKKCPKHALSYVAAIGAFIAVGCFNFNALLVILVAALAGILYQCVRKEKEK